jgi:hypothetical protein
MRTTKSRATSKRSAEPKRAGKKTGPRPKPIVEFPEPLFACEVEPAEFHEALDLHMRRHGDSFRHLHRAIVRDGETFDMATIRSWRSGKRYPRDACTARG